VVLTRKIVEKEWGESIVEKAWLTRRITVEEADPSQEFLDLMAPGDELWEFMSPPETWAHLAGRAGIALVRDGEIIDSFLTLMN
jgi:hypothetical protein